MVRWLVSVIFLLSSLQSVASVISLDDAVFGIDSLTYDAESNLAFLDLKETQLLSVEQVSNNLGVGGDFEGFHFATFSEVISLFENQTGISFPVFVDSASSQFAHFPDSATEIQGFMNLIGISFVSASIDFQASVGRIVVDDLLNSKRLTFAVGSDIFLPPAHISLAPIQDKNSVNSVAGVFLVRDMVSVPEPSAIGLLLFGVLFIYKRELIA